ncbi:MAG: bifunctional nuclease family protein, partial [Tannerella sp.]|nr:bifunctional nuclease family protein [Tannerella sp.]
YALILSDDVPRHIPVIVGVSEAQSIAVALENAKPPRPLTHDIFVNFANTYNIRLKEVFIYKFEEGIFYAEMIFDDGKREIRIESRTSDAVAIALRMNCQMYMLESIIHKCGIIYDAMEFYESEEAALFKNFNTEDIKDKKALKSWMALLSIDKINEYMAKAISEEKYEIAKMYKEELQRRENFK